MISYEPISQEIWLHSLPLFSYLESVWEKEYIFLQSQHFAIQSPLPLSSGMKGIVSLMEITAPNSASVSSLLYYSLIFLGLSISTFCFLSVYQSFIFLSPFILLFSSPLVCGPPFSPPPGHQGKHSTDNFVSLPSCQGVEGLVSPPRQPGGADDFFVYRAVPPHSAGLLATQGEVPVFSALARKPQESASDPLAEGITHINNISYIYSTLSSD